MKHLSFLLSFLCFSVYISAQTGPGGVGNSAGNNAQPINKMWFDASKLSLSGGNPVATWTDFSGNANNGVQTTANAQPIFQTGQINGYPAVVFDGTDDFIPINETSIEGTDYTIAIVSKRYATDLNSIILGGTDTGTDKNLHIMWSGTQFKTHHYSNDLQTDMVTSGAAYDDGRNTGEYGIFTTLLSSSDANNNRRHYQNNFYLTNADADANDPATLNSWVGAAIARANFGASDYFTQIDIAEIVIYSTALNDAQLQAVHQYLSEKYAITIDADKYTGNDAAFNLNVGGIGQATNGNHTTASSSGFYLSNPSNLDNGDYIFAGHNATASDAYNNNATGDGTIKAWGRTWYVEKTGNLDARIAFDLSEGITGGLHPGGDVTTNYVLLYRAAATGNFAELQTADGTINGDQIYFDLTDAELQNGYYTLGTKDETNSPLIGIPGKTWYSLVSGNWEDPQIWTLDPSGALPNNPSNETPNTSTTKAADKVIIKSGKTVTVNGVTAIGNAEIRVDGRLDLQSTTGHSLGKINGNGRILMSANNFPLGDATNFTSAGQGEGTVVYYGTDYTINTAHTFFDVEIILTASTNVLTFTKDLTVNGDLDVKTGELKINDDASTTILNITVNGNLTVEAAGKISVGTGNTIGTYSIGGTMPADDSKEYHSIYHQFSLKGNFTNNGTVRFTNQAAPIYNQFTNTGAVTFRFTGANNSKATLNNTTDFYNIVVDKGIDKTYVQEIYANTASCFKLFGANNVGRATALGYSTENPQVRKALFVKTGTLKLTGFVNIPTLSEGGVEGGNGDYAVGQNARFWIAGANVVVYTTANDNSTSGNTQVDDASGATINTGGSVQAMSMYGEFKISDGYFSTRNSAGFIFWAQANSQVKIEGGTVDVSQVRAGSGAGVASYTQSGGTLNVRGNEGVAGEVSNLYPIFGFDDASGVFNMSGGEIIITDNSGNATNNGFYVPSSVGNYNVTGGTVTVRIPAGTAFEIGSTAHIWNFNLEQLSGTGTSTVRLTHNLTVMGDLTINANCLLDVQDDADATNYDLSIGDDFFFNTGAEYNPRDNTTHFIGTASTSTVRIYDTATDGDLYFNNLTIKKEQNWNASIYDKVEVDGRTRTTGHPVEIRGNLLIERGDFYTEDYEVDIHGNIEVKEGLITNRDGKIVLNGAAQQTLKGTLTAELEFGSLEINNPAGAKLLSNINATNVALNQGIMDLNIYKLQLWGNISTTGTFSTSLMFQTSGLAGDGGLSLYIWGNATYHFPIGTNANSSVRYTPAWVDISNFSDGGLLQINPVDEELPTTSGPGSDALSYYWRTRHSAFATKPNAVYTFLASDLDDPTDATDGDISIPSAVAGEVLNESPYTRSNVDGDVNKSSIGGTVINNNLYFYTNNKTINAASYTAGKNTSFNGTLDIYYTTNNGIKNWNDQAKWTKTTDGVDDGNTGYPEAGDIAVIKSYGDANGNCWVYGNIDITVGAVVFDDALGGWNPRIWVTKTNALLDLGAVTGEGEIYLEVTQAASPQFVGATDLGDFSNQPNSVFNFKIDADNNTVNMPNNISVYPNIRIEGGDGANDDDNRILQTSIPIIVKGTVRLDRSSRWRINHDVSILNDLRITWQANRTTVEIGDDRQITLDIGRDFLLENGNGNDGARFVVKNDNQNSYKHKIRVGRNITVESSLDATSVVDLYNGVAPNNNAILELHGDDSGEFINSSSATLTPDLYRIVMNKEAASDWIAFNFMDAITVNGPTDGDEKAIELISGRLGLRDAGIDVTLTSGGANFKIPQEAKLWLGSSATARVSGYNTGIWLDGQLDIGYGVNALFNEGTNNYIEYTGSGVSEIYVNGGSSKFYVGSQIRRSVSTEEGVLNFRLTSETADVQIGTDAGNIPENNRGVLEILNTGSNFSMADNTKIVIANAQDNPTFPSLYLAPETSSLGTGSLIQFGNAATHNNQEMGMYSTIPYKNISTDNTSGNNPKVKLWIANQEITENLSIASSTEFIADGWDLTLKGNMTNSGGTYTANGNTTYFRGSATQTITGNTTFWNVVKDTESSTLTLGASTGLIIENELKLLTGSFDDNANTVDVYGDVTNEITTISDAASYGIRLSGTVQQNLIGDGTFAKLYLKNAAGAFAGTGNNFTISDKLYLDKGILNIGQNLLTFTNPADIVAVNPFSETNMIQTNISFTDAGVKKIFPVIAAPTTFIYPMGSQGKYTPVKFDITANANNTGYIRIRAADERHVSILEDLEAPDPEIADTANVLWYHWTLDANGISGFTAKATMEYYPDDAKVDTNPGVGYQNPNPYDSTQYITAVLLDEAAGTWNKFDYDTYNGANHELYFTFADTDDAGIDGDYTAGIDGSTFNGAIPDQVPAYVSIADGNWTDNTKWDTYPVSGGTVPAGGPKGAIVYIKTNIDLPGNFISSYATNICSGGKLDVGTTFGHRLGKVCGSGTLYLERGDMPAGVYDNFLLPDSGTVDFGGTDSYDILSELTEVNNITLSGTGDRRFPNLELQLHGHLIINGPNAINEHDQKILVKRNITFTAGTFNAGTGANSTIEMNGSSPQTISGAASFTGTNALNNFTINNSSGVTISTAIDIDNNLSLTNGNVFTTSANPFTVTNADAASITGGGSNSYVDGPLFKKINTGETFTYPIGNAGRYGSFIVSNTNTAGAQIWEAQYYNHDATVDGFDVSVFDTSLEYVYNDGYWRLKGPAGATANVTIRWDASTNAPSDATDRDKLRVAEWQANTPDEWVEVGNTVSNISQTSGTISTSGTGVVTFNEFGTGNYFAIGSDVVIDDKLWVGNTTAWETASNWNPSGIPSSNDNVTIPTAPTGGNFPVIGSAAESLNFTLEANATIEISATNSLIVNGNLSIGTGATFSVRNSSAGPASLLTKGSVTNNGTCVAESYFKGGVFHYFSVPVTNVNTNEFVTLNAQGQSVNFYSYNEANTDADWFLGWVRPSNEIMPAAKGYGKFVYTDALHTLNTGTFNNGDISFAISNSGSNPSNSWNLVGNPYPSSISADDFIAANSSLTTGTLYFWDDDGTLGTGYQTNDYATYNLSGAVAGGGGKVPNGFIPPGQGFFIKANTTGSLTFNNNMRRVNAGTVYKNQINDGLQRLRLYALSASNDYNEILIAFRPEATQQVDNLYDGKKLAANAQISLYSIIGEEAFAIQSLPNISGKTTIPLGITSGQTEDYTFTLKDVENINDFIKIELYDAVTKTTTNIRTGSYTVNLPVGTYNNRFFLNVEEPEVTRTVWQASKSTDWNVAANWDNGVPSLYTDAVIPSGTVVTTSSIEFHNLEIGKDASLEIDKNHIVTLSGKVILESDGDKTAMLLDNGNNKLQAVVEKTLPTAERFYYLASPVANAKAQTFGSKEKLQSDEYDGSKLYYYNNGWQRVTDEYENLDPMKGYAFKSSFYPNWKYRFEGILNTDLQKVSISNQGFHLIGNPYPSALDWGSGTTANGWTGTDKLYPTLWYRVGGSGGQNGGGNFASYNRLSGIATNGGQQYIPPMQSVWVYAAEPAELTVNNTARTLQTVSMYKTEIAHQGLKLMVETNGLTDEMFLFQNENAANEFDAFDTEKMIATESGYPQLYVYINNKKLAANGMNAIKDVSEYVLHFIAAESGTYSIEAEELNNIMSNQEIDIVLYDKYEDTEINLNETSSYEFHSNNGEYTDRFALKISKREINIDNTTEFAYTISDNVVELKQLNTVEEAGIFDVSGRMIWKTNNPTSETEAVTLPKDGIYLLRVIINGQPVSHKISLR